MTTNQPRTLERGLPECDCPADCGGRPELRVRLAPAYPSVRPSEHQTPPDLPHSPTRRGELVFDTLNQRHGVVMDRYRSLVYLRPERGGAEWDVDAKWLVKPA